MVSPQASRLGEFVAGSRAGILTGTTLSCGTWNVRGLTELKLHELILHMKYNNIDILCIQETWTKKAAVYVEHGFEVILSGSELEGRTFTGVGFILAPHVRRRIRSYKQINDRVAVINVSVEGGVVAIFSAYAPHNLRPLDEK